MQLGMVGLGRMGANMVRRLIRGGHTCVVYDVSPQAVKDLEAEGALGASSVEDFVAKLESPKAAWVMVPAAYTGDTVDQMAAAMSDGDIIIDGGNSYYHDDIHRAAALKPRGIHYIDVGTSGGVFGLERGYCLMIGGEDDPVTHLDPIFRTIAPGFEAAPRSAGRGGQPSTSEQGYLHCGPNGAGHFVKMVHNGIEYGIMAAYAEGLNILHKANIGTTQPAPSRRRDDSALESRVLPVRHRHRRGGRVVAAGQRGVVLAARPDRPCPACRPEAGVVRRSGVGFRRGALDGHGRHRRGRSRPRAHRRPLRAVLVPGRGRLRRQDPVRHAQGVRRPRREGGGYLAPSSKVSRHVHLGIRNVCPTGVASGRR